MKQQFFKKIALLLCCILISSVFFGCKKEQSEVKKLNDLEFTVVEEADLPEELLTSINEKKSTPFKMTYSNDNYLYIVRGYGEQRSGGYSITADELFLAEDGIHFKTTLLGPGKDEPVTQVMTYPFIVVKTEFLDQKVIWD